MDRGGLNLCAAYLARALRDFCTQPRSVSTSRQPAHSRASDGKSDGLQRAGLLRRVRDQTDTFPAIEGRLRRRSMFVRMMPPLAARSFEYRRTRQSDNSRGNGRPRSGFGERRTIILEIQFVNVEAVRFQAQAGTIGDQKTLLAPDRRRARESRRWEV